MSTTCNGACTVTHVLSVSNITGTVTGTVTAEPAPLTEERMSDMILLWSLFFGAALLIFLARKFLNLWDKAPHESL